jgi:DNA-binding transcriptional MerR regulator
MSQAPAEQFVGIGYVADAFGISPSALRKWEREGRIPAAARVAGQDRRIYRADDLVAIRAQVNQMRRRGDPERAA